MTDPRQLLRAATERLAAADVPSPAVDAELLLAHVLGVERARLVLLDEVPADAEDAFDALVARRGRREPLQHIVGTAPFRYVTVAVGPGVFIPRPETELLVDAVLPHLRSRQAPVVVDLCSGSGALAIAIAHEVRGARVVAVERDADALVWLYRNAASSAVEVLAADVRAGEPFIEFAGTVDAVVSNPPYVPADTAVAVEVRADPPGAVFAGPDGLDLIGAVIDRAAELLRPGGVLAVEHDDTHARAVPDLLAADARWDAIEDHDDLTGTPRYAVAIRR